MLCPLEHPAHMHPVRLRNRTLPFLHPLTVSMTSHVHDPEEGGGLGETRSSIGHLVPSHGASRREPEPDALWPLCRPGRRCVASQRCTALHRARSLARWLGLFFFFLHSLDCVPSILLLKSTCTMGSLAPFTLKGFYLLTWGNALGSNVWNTIVSSHQA